MGSKVLKPVNTKGAAHVIRMEEEPLSPAARLFHTPGLNCSIIAIMGSKNPIDVDAVKRGLQDSLIKHPRFSSVLEVVDDKKGRREIMRWSRTRVDIEQHVFNLDLDPNMESVVRGDQFLDDYITDLTKTSMDATKPLWEVHILNFRTSQANAVVVLRIHHSMGDGVSLISLLLACTRKTSDPQALPTIPKMSKKRLSQLGGNGSTTRPWFFVITTMWSMLVMILNTLVDVTLFVATIFVLKDTETPIKGSLGVGLTPKRIVYRMLSLNDIKLVKHAMNTTINDVLLGATQAGLSAYLNRRYASEDTKDGEATEERNNLPKHIRFRAALFMNTRSSAGIEALVEMMEKESINSKDWGNRIGYVLLPFTIALRDDPLNYIHEAKAIMDRKKLSLEAKCTYSIAWFIAKSFGMKRASALTHRAIRNATMTFSNVAGPQEEISFYGHPIAYLAATVYGHPQALTVNFQSYGDKMAIVLAVDQDVIPNPHQLCNDVEDSLQLIKDAVIQRGLVKKDAP